MKNVGGADYHGEVVVRDQLPPAASGTTIHEVGGVWNCSRVARVPLQTPGDDHQAGSEVVLSVQVFLDPGSYNEGCSLKNTAKILHAPGGSVQNTNKNNDEISSTLELPDLIWHGKPYCHAQVPAMPCPPGFVWNGEGCGRIGITTTPPPVRACPEGFAGTYPDCDRITGEPECPEGTVGDYPNCRKVDDGGDDDRDCPRGMLGDYPNCYKPGGSTDCTDGRVRRGSQCVCPGSLVWNGDRCVRRKCPEGMRGTFPHCHKVIIEPKKCRAGTVGRWPNCRTIEKALPARYDRQISELPENRAALPGGHVRPAPALHSLNWEKQFRGGRISSGRRISEISFGNAKLRTSVASRRAGPCPRPSPFSCRRTVVLSHRTTRSGDRRANPTSSNRPDGIGPLLEWPGRPRLYSDRLR